MKEFSERKAKYFATVDEIDYFALVALDPDHSDEIVAVVRYDREPDSYRAEYAALVEDRWQDQGVGTALTKERVSEALDKGIRFFYAMVMGKNKRMLEVLRHRDLPEQERLGNCFTILSSAAIFAKYNVNASLCLRTGSSVEAWITLASSCLCRGINDHRRLCMGLSAENGLILASSSCLCRRLSSPPMRESCISSLTRIANRISSFTSSTSSSGL